jgi:tetratricopeptide (TPR) repeat protein
MVVFAKTGPLGLGRKALGRFANAHWSAILLLIAVLCMTVSPSLGQAPTPSWQAQVRKYAEAKDWDSAMRVVEQEIARAPQDMDVRAWRARVLAWSGKLLEAEKEYREILKLSRTDPDNWLGLANVCIREGKLQEAPKAINAAEQLVPKRPDIHAARARILRAAGKTNNAQSEFRSALQLDPGSLEAREGLVSVRRGAQHELRFGQDNDLLSYSADFHDEWISLGSQWTSHWATAVAGDFYQCSGAEAGKFVASIARRQSWGALNVGGAIGHDNAVIPKSEAFFDLDHGWKTGERDTVRGVEISYAQHWYWYQAARILTLNGTTLVYLPQDWTSRLGLRVRAALSLERVRSGGPPDSGVWDFPWRTGATLAFPEIFSSRRARRTLRSSIKSGVLLRRRTVADCDSRLRTSRT